jgi:hypothetical protein
MVIDEFTSALEQRRYTRETIRTTDQKLAVGHILTTVKHIAAATGRVSPVIMGQLIDERLGEGQHHICCSKCKEPLLIGSSRKMALDLYHRIARPRMMIQIQGMDADEAIALLKTGKALPKGVATVVPDNTDMESAIAMSTGYRSARLGPDSPMLATCPTCGNALEPESVSEYEEL